MEYKYYMEVNSYEHMLNAFEIAKLYDLQTLTGKPHNRLVARILSEHHKKFGDPKMYYKTAKGDLMRVWPEYVYKPIFDKFIKENEHHVQITAIIV